MSLLSLAELPFLRFRYNKASLQIALHDQLLGVIKHVLQFKLLGLYLLWITEDYGF